MPLTREGSKRRSESVIANKQDAAGLEHARRASVDTLVLDHQDKAKFATREDYDKELVRQFELEKCPAYMPGGFHCDC
jgi:folate-dependent phosphoribosylglycinamide formyltransferase PurN